MDRMSIQVEPLDLRIKKKTDTILTSTSKSHSLLNDRINTKNYFWEHSKNKKNNLAFPYVNVGEPVDNKFRSHIPLQAQQTPSLYNGDSKPVFNITSKHSSLPSSRCMLDSASPHVNKGSHTTYCVRKPAMGNLNPSMRAHNHNLIHIGQPSVQSTVHQSATNYGYDSNLHTPSFYGNTWIPPFRSMDNLSSPSSNSRQLNNSLDASLNTSTKFKRNQELVRSYLSTGVPDRTLSQYSFSSGYDMFPKKVPCSYTVTVPQALPFTSLREENIATLPQAVSFTTLKEENIATVPPFNMLNEENKATGHKHSMCHINKLKDINNNDSVKAPLRRIAPKQPQIQMPPVMSWSNPSFMQDTVLSPASKRKLIGNSNTQKFPKSPNRTVPLMSNRNVPNPFQRQPATINNTTTLHSYLLNNERLPGTTWKSKDDNNNDQTVDCAYSKQSIIGIKPMEQTGTLESTWTAHPEGESQKDVTSTINANDERRRQSANHCDEDVKSNYMTYKNINKTSPKHGRYPVYSVLPYQQDEAKPWTEKMSNVTVYKPKYYFMNKFSQTSDDDNNNETNDDKYLDDKKVSTCDIKDESLDSGNDTDSDDTWNYSEGFEKWISDLYSRRDFEHEDNNNVNSGNGSQMEISSCEPFQRKMSAQRIDVPSQSVTCNHSDTYVHKLKKFSDFVPKNEDRKRKFSVSVPKNEERKKKFSKSVPKNEERRNKKERRRRKVPAIPVGGLGVNSPSDLDDCEAFYWCHCCERSVKHFNVREHFTEHGNEGDINLDNYLLQVYGHVTKHWKGYNKEGRCVYLCGLCDQAMLYHQGFRWHILTHGRGHRCDRCNKLFLSKKKLTRHQNYGCDAKMNCCSTCGRKFSSSKHMKIHIARVHCRARPSNVYKCSYCGKCLSSRGSLTTHTRLHTGINPYRCNVCGRSYPQNVQLKLHMKVHRKTDP